MSNIWLVVAESSRAKIYQTDIRLSELLEIDDLVHPASRLHDRDITSDLPGRGASSGSGSHHGIDDQTNAKDEEIDVFARQIDSHLSASLNQGKFENIAVIAPPAFLGRLRKHMSKSVAERVIYELDKSLLHCNARELKTHLPKHL